MALITAPRHPPDLEKVVIDCGGPAIFAELYFKDPTCKRPIPSFTATLPHIMQSSTG